MTLKQQPLVFLATCVCPCAFEADPLSACVWDSQLEAGLAQSVEVNAAGGSPPWSETGDGVGGRARKPLSSHDGSGRKLTPALASWVLGYQEHSLMGT